jgi:hypothetical protein
MAGQVEGEHFKVEIMGLSSAFWGVVVWKRKKKKKGCYWQAYPPPLLLLLGRVGYGVTVVVSTDRFYARGGCPA